MRRTLLFFFALTAFAACTPGTGENGACDPANVGECQVSLDCFYVNPDAGADAGGAVCKFPCGPSSPCPTGGHYACVDPPGYCGPDAGHN